MSDARVAMLRWPDQDGERRRLSLTGTPRLLLVEVGQDPPRVLDCLEDWIRVPAADSDLEARLKAVETRGHSHTHDAPGLDDNGVLRFAGRWVALPPLEARITDLLIERMGAVVGRSALTQVGWPGAAPDRNALDVHMLRLRRRLAPLGLAIRTVRSRGYLLEVVVVPPLA